MEKKIYETPEVTKVEFDASDRITASPCWSQPQYRDGGEDECRNL